MRNLTSEVNATKGRYGAIVVFGLLLIAHV
jgi:hypothetical protein